MKQTNNYPFMMTGYPSSYTLINNKRYLYFGGTSYYSLHGHPEVVRAASEALNTYGITSATSRATTGMTPLYDELERKAAKFFDTDDAVYLPSGYLSNIAGIAALRDMGKADRLYVDANAHYCNIEGALASSLPVIQYAHNDPADLRNKIAATLKPKEKPLIITDGVFGTFGRFADVPTLLETAEQYDGALWIDDAHGVGVVGEHGRGTYDYYGKRSPRLFFGATVSKAFGAFGGLIVGDSDFIARVRNGNVMKGSNQPPAVAAAAAIKGFEILSSNPDMRANLHNNARYLKAGMRKLGFDVEDNDLPIVAFTFGNNADIQKLRDYILSKNIYIQMLNYAGTGVYNRCKG
ncbi:MAG: aminotransferase class I/II-fold pyridoxal phosphate-dependent enzyme [Tannerella sp.]|nr:aminotransferase class I/II-fold pyridoxal phosphate-dependent enzyme [Tannerella sp.]